MESPVREMPSVESPLGIVNPGGSDIARCLKIIQLADQADMVREFANSVVRGLVRRPGRLECRFLYDTRGSELYERITRQPEYYPTRTEAGILARCARRLREITGPVSLLELGSGSSAKTDHLLRAWEDDACYIPVDISESALRHAGEAICARHPGVRVLGLNGDYEEVFPLFSGLSPLMVVFLGSTIGNFSEEEATLFFRRIAENLNDGDYFLLGADLEKDRAVLEAAYNDAAGVTAEFTRNLFARMNRELGSGLDLSAIEHVARWRPERRRIEIHARFEKPQTLRVAPLDRSFQIAAGEEILVEISRKFVLRDLQDELENCALRTREIFTDEQGWFALILLQKRPGLSGYS
jgi:L-histidine Nalpha-methyltransferase